MRKKKPDPRGLNDIEDALDTFDNVLEDVLENMVASGVDPLVLANHVETYIANWQEQYK